MTATRRILVLLGAPLIVVVGLAGAWGVRNGAEMVSQIEAWAYALEHSAEPVVMHLPFVPVYVDGTRMGRLSAVVVQRNAPGAVDSLHIRVTGANRAPADGCRLRLDVDAFDADGPFAIKRLMRCAPDTTGLVPFGTVRFVEANEIRPLFLAAEHLPCDHVSHASAACIELASEIRAIQHQVQDEVRFELRNLRREIRAEVRANVRAH